jgi:hypothetical protein
VRVLGAIAHTRLSGEVDDTVEALALEQSGDGLMIGEVHAMEREARLAVQGRKARLLQVDIVVGIKIVEAHDGVAAF